MSLEVMSLEVMHAVCDLALPRACAGCGVAASALCDACAEQLRELRRGPAFVALPTPCPVGFPRAWSQTAYDGCVAEMLRAFKDGGRRDVGPLLGALLRSALAAVLAQDRACREAVATGRSLVVVPMPSRFSAIRERGREPTTELARHATQRARRLAVRRVLRVSGAGDDQAGLSAAQRSVNVRGAMRVTAGGRHLVQGAVCVVTDDIVTTGSSLTEARAALLSAGAMHVVAATVAATQRHGDPGSFTPAGSVV